MLKTQLAKIMIKYSITALLSMVISFAPAMADATNPPTKEEGQIQQKASVAEKIPGVCNPQTAMVMENISPNLTKPHIRTGGRF